MAKAKAVCVWWGGSKPHNETWGGQNCVQDNGDGGVTRLRWFSQAGLSLALLTLIIIMFLEKDKKIYCQISKIVAKLFVPHIARSQNQIV